MAPPTQPAQDGLKGIVWFNAAEIEDFRRAGFLTAAEPTFHDAQNAVFDLIEAAWKAGLKAEVKVIELKAEPAGVTT